MATYSSSMFYGTVMRAFEAASVDKLQSHVDHGTELTDYGGHVMRSFAGKSNQSFTMEPHNGGFMLSLYSYHLRLGGAWRLGNLIVYWRYPRNNLSVTSTRHWGDLPWRQGPDSLEGFGVIEATAPMSDIGSPDFMVALDAFREKVVTEPSKRILPLGNGQWRFTNFSRSESRGMICYRPDGEWERFTTVDAMATDDSLINDVFIGGNSWFRGHRRPRSLEWQGDDKAVVKNSQGKVVGSIRIVEADYQLDPEHQLKVS